ncbi:MAG: sodium-independent anion transporter [Elusimicrobia bacterium RIFCSPLOWO2_01_FULL_54_10]|nr:MAG: sodium-independent anion transporter [Elusimicrobia bacterium RIFCSPLOWO2_01_FULL_54_10]
MYLPKSIVCLRNYSLPQFKSDIQAGIVVGLVALPLAMAFAIASGLPPERGLFTAVIAGFLISALGGSRVQIGGPTGAFVVIVSGVAAKYGYHGLAIATFMAGVILIGMGLARLGKVVKFIPYPVITGFTSGIAVIIFSTQMKDFFGDNLYSPLLALFTIICISYWPKNWHRIPGPIAALVIGTATAYFLHLPVETIQSRFGSIPSGLPAPQWPHFSWQEIKILFPSALTIAVLGSIESLLSAVVADGMIGSRHKSNTELIAQGIANLASPIFGGIPATGAIARTATNIKNGGRTPVAGMVHAAVLFLVLLWAGSLAEKIPLAILAGILVVVSYHMSEWRSFRSLLKGPRSDVAVLLVTFLLTILVDLTVAVEVGMVLASFLFMKNMADLTEVRAMSREADEEDSGQASDSLRANHIPEGVEVFSIQGSFFFGAASKLLETIRFVEKPPQILVLDMKDVLHMDATGIYILEQILNDCGRRAIRLVITGMRPAPMAVLAKSGPMEKIGRDNVRPDLREFLDEVRRKRKEQI